MMLSLEEIEIALARFFNYRQTIIMPNFYIEHECDLLILRKTGYAVEVEIKRSVADMKNDFKKKHNHESNRIAEFYYAFPDSIADKCTPLVPDHAGILVVSYGWNGYLKVVCTKSPKRNKQARKWAKEEIEKVLRYSVYRIWNLKRVLARYKKKENANK